MISRGTWSLRALVDTTEEAWIQLLTMGVVHMLAHLVRDALRRVLYSNGIHPLLLLFECLRVLHNLLRQVNSVLSAALAIAETDRLLTRYVRRTSNLGNRVGLEVDVQRMSTALSLRLVEWDHPLLVLLAVWQDSRLESRLGRKLSANCGLHLLLFLCRPSVCCLVVTHLGRLSLNIRRLLLLG